MFSGDKLKRWRTKKEVSRLELSNKTQESQKFLRDCELGKALPTVGTVQKIAQALEIDPEDLLDEGDELEMIKEVQKKIGEQIAVMVQLHNHLDAWIEAVAEMDDKRLDTAKNLAGVVLRKMRRIANEGSRN